MPLLLLLIAAADPAALIDTARTLTTADHRCTVAADTTDISVCGMRNADRFRVPFVGYEPGDPRAEGAMAERQRLMNRTDNCQERRAIAVGCGFAGVHVTTGGNGTHIAGARKLAP